MTTEEKVKKQLAEFLRKSAEAVPPETPAIMNDPRLEDAFKTPECNEDGYALTTIPAVWSEFSHGEKPNGVKILSRESAIICSRLYSRYLDEPALIWSAPENELYIYIPDPKGPAVAFKGSTWTCAKKLKAEFKDISLESLYVQGWLHRDKSDK